MLHLAEFFEECGADGCFSFAAMAKTFPDLEESLREEGGAIDSHQAPNVAIFISGWETFTFLDAFSIGAMLPSWPFRMKTCLIPSLWRDSRISPMMTISVPNLSEMVKGKSR